MISSILTSLFKTTTVSVVVALVAKLMFEQSPTPWFIVTFLGQFVLFYVWNSYMSYRFRLDINQQETERIKAFETQGVNVNCAHCSTTNYIPVRFDEDNKFDCDACGKTNAVYVDVTVAQPTQFLDKQNISINSIIKEKIDATDKLKG